MTATSSPTDLLRAAVTVAPGRSEVQHFELPHDLRDGGLLRVEAAGICGSDVAAHLGDRPARVMGHENVGRIAALSPAAAAAWQVELGELVLLEEYLPCGQCLQCRIGEHRYCVDTDAAAAEPLRYGTTPIDVWPGIWGGYSEYQYLHPRSMIHRVPDGVTAELATLGLPIANGIQFLQLEAGVGPGDLVVVIGPGQQGQGCVVAAVHAGADVVVFGRASDGARLAAAARLGARGVVDVDADDAVRAFLALSGGRAADVVVDAAAGTQETVDLAGALLRPGGQLLLAASRPDGGRLDVRTLARRHLVVRGVRGHTFVAVERALEVIRRHELPLDVLCTHSFALDELDAALTACRAGTVIHGFVDPWRPPAAEPAGSAPSAIDRQGRGAA